MNEPKRVSQTKLDTRSDGDDMLDLKRKENVSKRFVQFSTRQMFSQDFKFPFRCFASMFADDVQ